MFRGCLQDRLRRLFDWKEAWIVQAGLFAAWHMIAGSLISHFVLGLVLGYARYRTRRLWASMLAHCLYNASVVLGEAGALPVFF